MIRARALRAYHLKATASSWKQRKLQTAGSSGVFHSVHSMHAAPIPCRTISTATYSSNDNNIRWRFPVDDRTEDMIMQIHHGIMGTTSILTFNAVMPITYDLMEEALNILYEKVETLRICFRLRENQLWVADMPQRLLDYKLVTGNDIEKEYSDLTSSSFDIHNGPLWKARLMTSSENTSCQFPDLRAKFPHQYDMLLSLHHAASDGVVLKLVTDLLLSIIDNLLQGIPVDRQQVGELRDGIETREEENRIKAAFENDPASLKAALQEYEMGKHLPLLIEAFGSPSEANPSTHVFPPVLLEKDVMSRIVHKCRSKEVTLNSCMIAIGNTSLVEMVRDAGLKRNSYSITSVHPVNTRRLMARNSKPYLGFHVISPTVTITTPHNVKNHFWEYTKNLDTEFRNKLKRNEMCKQRVLNAMMRPEGYTHEAYYAQPMPLCYDYIFTNVYSPETNIQGIGKFVQLTSIQQKILVHKRSCPLMHGWIGFRGQVSMSVAHSTVAHSKEVISKWFDKNVALLHDISNAMI